MNVGRIDLTIRLVLGLLLIAMGFTVLGGLTTSKGVVAIAIGAVLGVTGIFSFCPIYKFFGISTMRSRDWRDRVAVLRYGN